MAVVCDQRRSSVLHDPPSQLLDQDAALRAHLHVTPPLIRLSGETPVLQVTSKVTGDLDRGGVLTWTRVEDASVGDGARTNLSRSGSSGWTSTRTSLQPLGVRCHGQETVTGRL